MSPNDPEVRPSLDTFRDDFGEGRETGPVWVNREILARDRRAVRLPLPLVPALKRDGALDLWWSMIFSENRHLLFRITR